MGTTKITKAADAILAGERRVLARLITALESTEPQVLQGALAIVGAVMATPLAQQRWDACARYVVAGSPGAGKSTLLQRLGQCALAQGTTPALLLVDPASPVHRGAILGDQTRMPELAHTDAFIRPSANRPGADSLAASPVWAASLSPATFLTQMVCAAAGFAPIFTETVGLGQAETVVADAGDALLVIIPADAGDELQGLKKGIIEIADLLFVNKADGDLRQAAERTAGEYRSARRITHSSSTDAAGVQLGSALHGDGVDELYAAMQQHIARVSLADSPPQMHRQMGHRQMQLRRCQLTLWHAALARMLADDPKYTAQLNAYLAQPVGDATPYLHEWYS